MADLSFETFAEPAKTAPDAPVLAQLVAQAALSPRARGAICARAAGLIRQIRKDANPGVMEQFLAEYGLSTAEGVALMCLAEAMLRVPDATTIDALIEDKIAPSDWSKHLGEATSPLVNASTWALMLTGRVLDEGDPAIARVLRGAIKRIGEPLIRVAVGQAMKQMGRQFVLGQSIETALERARGFEKKGYTYSYDMLGEAAMTKADATRYTAAYEKAIAGIARAATHGSVEANPGISIKLSALHPRYSVAQEARVMAELVPVVHGLALKAKAAGIGFNIDAEEQDRLVLSLKVIEAVVSQNDLAGWNGFGVVVQAYGKRASQTIDWLHALATRYDRKIMVRLVKGAYWDTEMKRAQVEGLAGFPLFTNKAATDVSYISNARKLLDYSDRIYPQFATHNAHSVAAILEMAKGRAFEFQRLHGMGAQLHDIVLAQEKTRCRIYAPVGAHRDLLAYLVRRLLENGANSSFVNQLVDEDVSPEDIAADPFAALEQARAPGALCAPQDLFAQEGRVNSKGFDLSDEATLSALFAARDTALPLAHPITRRPATGTHLAVHNPATGAVVSSVLQGDGATALRAIEDARLWDAPVAERAKVLRKASDLFEENAGVIFATLAREAGKTLSDCVGELREAVDFLRYYADQAEARDAIAARGIFTAISPWNFPLAIFTGQVAAALAAGNAVIAKPAEATPVIATLAVTLMHRAGVPACALQLVTGTGGEVGRALTCDPRINGVVFTGSTTTAQAIRRAMADRVDPGAPLIAETGGLNAMIVDSTALPEQAVRDIVASAFQSAGQRCSALRCLYVQEDVVPHFMEMLKGAMNELTLGDPWDLRTDVGPVIDQTAYDAIAGYLAQAREKGMILHQVAVPDTGLFIAPTLIKVGGIADLGHEVFGPVLHVATFKSKQIHKVIADVNARGFGLTFGLHTRIDTRVQEVADGLNVGNIYVNRNQIGAIVSSQPFGGEGLSGTGPKAGGPSYLTRFAAPDPMADQLVRNWDRECDIQALRKALADKPAGRLLSKTDLPGPTGEANTLRLYVRGPILCMGPGAAAVAAQVAAVEALGGVAQAVDGALSPADLTALDGFDGALWWGGEARLFAQALAARNGPILPLITAMPDRGHVTHERHLCVDTTAAGGNAALLAG
ncbi:Bifunctional protein PutA [Aquimixticola soesokkakensis]|uniref:Bifunctional protein PutA n=1 Tax=Aquimixticola soesokkakensis TaxID=1519096 RepID=A0A1Y5T4Y2_9RHOB|nr:bifunctional proline dehydrogenase/L-glutamate gamma-semialdehyde dehydrogenase PutA [Aquimixticola soesokkakensis]SLN55897.1 Bifunctional protein PutA [Aquimixticola soesokkakensis]